jgi:hypothetical protein
MTLVAKIVVSTLLPLFAVLGAKAGELRAQDVQTAKLVICGSAEKAQHFAAKHQDIQAVIAADSDVTSGTSAPCLIAGIAYITGQQLERVRNKGASYAVTEITIVGVATPYGFLGIKPEVVYTLLKVGDENA